MKKLKYVFGFLLFVLPVLSLASIDTNLKYGAKGQEVTELQEFLIDKGFLQSQATGNFYSLTQKAAIAYQTSEQLPATGYVGPLTRAKINAELDAEAFVANQEETDETGTTSAPVDTSNSAMTQAKIDALVQQVKDLLTQAQTQATQMQQQTQAQTQILGQIQQNTIPVPVQTPAQPIIIPVMKDIIIETQSIYNVNGVGYDIWAFYTENGNAILNVPITFTSDDDGAVGNNGAPSVIKTATQLSNKNTGKGKVGAIFYYIPKDMGQRTLTLTANGVTKTVIVNGQVDLSNSQQ